jgi:peptidase E
MTVNRRILAIGGGGFMMEGKFSAIDRELLHLTGKPQPRVCLIPTPTGDAEEVLQRFYSAYDPWCDARQLTPFRKVTDRSVPLRDVAAELCSFDAVFITGGSTKSALGVWREWKIDQALSRAYQSGVLLAGMSAGAICWFEQGFTDSYGDGYSPLRGLGLLAGGCSAYHNCDGPRTAELLESVRTGRMPRTFAIDDYSAVLFANEAPAAIYSWNAGGSARHLQSDGNSVSEAALQVETTTLHGDPK